MWVTKPKHHLFDHALRRAILDKENPVHWWCFKDEDIMGQWGRVSKVVHGACIETRTMTRYLWRVHADLAAAGSR